MADAIEAAAKNASALDPLTSINARKAANIRWDQCPDRTAATQAMRDGQIAKARETVLKEHRERTGKELTDEVEIQRRIQRKFQIKYDTMRANSLKARRAKAQQRKEAEAKALTEALADAIIEVTPDEAA